MNVVLREEIKATITVSEDTVYNLTTDDFHNNVSITSQCVNGNSIEPGSVASATFSATVKIAGVNRYSLIGAVVSVQICKGSEWQQAGVYTITSATRNRDIITFSASDNMMLLDNTAFTSDENNQKINEIYSFLSVERSIYDVLEYVVVTLGGLELAQTKEEFEQLSNSDFTTIAYENPENAYLRDWLSWIAEFVGGFACADVNGKIIIKQFESLPSLTITNADISLDTSDIADFRMINFDIAITCYDGIWYKTFTILNEGESQNTIIYIDLADNPLAQGYYHLIKQRYSDEIADGETDSERTKQMYDFTGAIWDALAKKSFRPFSATVHIDEMLKTGQCIQIQNAEGDFYSVQITHHTWTLNGGQQIKCIGEDTRLLADYKNRSAVKRESEKLQAKINTAKGIPITQAEFDQIKLSGGLIEGAVYNIIG